MKYHAKNLSHSRQRVIYFAFSVPKEINGDARTEDRQTGCLYISTNSFQVLSPLQIAHWLKDLPQTALILSHKQYRKLARFIQNQQDFIWHRHS